MVFLCDVWVDVSLQIWFKSYHINVTTMKYYSIIEFGSTLIASDIFLSKQNRLKKYQNEKLFFYHSVCGTLNYSQLKMKIWIARVSQRKLPKIILAHFIYQSHVRLSIFDFCNITYIRRFIIIIISPFSKVL